MFNKERDRGEKERDRGERKKMNKIYLNGVLKKNRIFDESGIVKWCVIYYKISFWDGKC